MISQRVLQTLSTSKIIKGRNSTQSIHNFCDKIESPKLYSSKGREAKDEENRTNGRRRGRKQNNISNHVHVNGLITLIKNKRLSDELKKKKKLETQL